MSFTTSQPEKIDSSSYHIPELQELKNVAEIEASAALERALSTPVEGPRFNLEEDDELDTNPAILQETQALGDAQKEAQPMDTERMRYVESPIKICEFVGKAGPAIYRMRHNVLQVQDPETIAALRMRANI